MFTIPLEASSALFCFRHTPTFLLSDMKLNTVCVAMALSSGALTLAAPMPLGAFGRAIAKAASAGRSGESAAAREIATDTEAYHTPTLSHPPTAYTYQRETRGGFNSPPLPNRPQAPNGPPSAHPRPDPRVIDPRQTWPQPQSLSLPSEPVRPTHRWDASTGTCEYTCCPSLHRMLPSLIVTPSCFFLYTIQSTLLLITRSDTYLALISPAKAAISKVIKGRQSSLPSVSFRHSPKKQAFRLSIVNFVFLKPHFDSL